MACRWSGANQLRPLFCHQRRETKRSPADHLGIEGSTRSTNLQHIGVETANSGSIMHIIWHDFGRGNGHDMQWFWAASWQDAQWWSPALSLKFLKFEMQSCFNMFQPIAFKTTIRPVPWGQPHSHSPRLHSPGGRPRGLHRDPHCHRSRRPQRSHGGVLNGARIFRVFSCFFHVLSGGFRMLNSRYPYEFLPVKSRYIQLISNLLISFSQSLDPLPQKRHL